MRDTSYAANTATAAWLPGAADSVTLLGAANTRMAWVHRADEPVTVQEDTGGTAPAAEETPCPGGPHTGTGPRDHARADPGGDARPHRGPDADPRRNANPCPDSSPYGSPDSGSDASTHPGARPDGGLAG